MRLLFEVNYNWKFYIYYILCDIGWEKDIKGSHEAECECGCFDPYAGLLWFMIHKKFRLEGLVIK